MEVIRDIYNQLLTRAAAGELRLETRRVPLAEIEQARDHKEASGVRVVIVPQPRINR